MSFSAIIGQYDVKKRLGSALMGDPGHAYVFVGPEGIGKATTARAFAQALLCRSPSAEGACGQCVSCHHFNNQVHPDYRVLSIEGKDKNIKVERVRRQICSDLAMHPQFGDRKVYLIAADDLNEQGQNALLKSLEEPPAYAFFLLTIANPEQLLPTVRSRVIPLVMQRSTPEDINLILEQHNLSDPETAVFFARFSGGLPGAALDLAGSEWFGQLRRETLELFSSLPVASRSKLLTAGFQFFDQYRDQTSIILDMLGSLIRDLLVYIVGSGNCQLTNEDQRDMLEQQPIIKQLPQNAKSRLNRAHAALMSAQRGLAANASYEGLICQVLLVLRKELAHA